MPGISGVSHQSGVRNISSPTESLATPRLSVNVVRNIGLMLGQHFDAHITTRTPRAMTVRPQSLHSAQQFRQTQVEQALTTTLPALGVSVATIDRMRNQLASAPGTIARDNVEMILLGLHSRREELDSNPERRHQLEKDVFRLVALMKKHSLTGRTPLGCYSQHGDYNKFMQLRGSVAAYTDTSVHLRQLTEYVHDYFASHTETVPEARALFTARLSNLQAMVEGAENHSVEHVMDRLVCIEQMLHLLRDVENGEGGPVSGQTTEPQGSAPDSPTTALPPQPAIHFQIGNINIHNGNVYTDSFNTRNLFPKGGAASVSAGGGVFNANLFNTPARAEPAATGSADVPRNGCPANNNPGANGTQDNDLTHDALRSNLPPSLPSVVRQPERFLDRDRPDGPDNFVSPSLVIQAQSQQQNLRGGTNLDGVADRPDPAQGRVQTPANKHPPVPQLPNFVGGLGSARAVSAQSKVPRLMNTFTVRPLNMDSHVPEKVPTRTVKNQAPAAPVKHSPVPQLPKFVGGPGSARALSRQPGAPRAMDALNAGSLNASQRSPEPVLNTTDVSLERAKTQVPVKVPTLAPPLAGTKNASLTELHTHRNQPSPQKAMRWPEVTPASRIVGSPGSSTAMPAFVVTSRKK